MQDQNDLKKFRLKEYRDGYLQSRIRGRIAYQIQALRDKLGLTQQAFAQLTGKKQSVISRLENVEYGKVSVQTLLDIALAADVALVVKFTSYPDFLDQTRLMTPEALQPKTIYETLSGLQSAPRVHGQAFARALDRSEQGEPRATAYAAVNDNWVTAANNAAVGVSGFTFQQSRSRLVS